MNEIVDVIDGDRGINYPSGDELQDRGHTLFLSATNVTKDGFVFDYNQYITEEKSNKLGNGKLVTDDIVLTSRGSIGHVAWYNTAIKQQIPFSRINSGMLILRSKGNTKTCFVAQFLKSPLGKKQIDLISFGSAQPQLTKKDVSNYLISIPCDSNEQILLGEFFNHMDNLITLHKRKLDGLKELKRGYLQQMFPQAGENVPRVRFAGFTGDWEMRKLGEISTKVTDKNKNNEFNETLTNSAEYGIISQRDFFDKDISNGKNLDGYFIVRPDDFVYNPRISNFAPVGPIKRNLLGRTGVMSPLYYIFRITEGNYTFVEKYFETAYWHDFMVLNGDNGVRSDRFNIKDSIFTEMPIPFPSIIEQALVGSLLRNLDDQIAVQQQKLNQLKQLKFAYLQKMFV